MLAIATFVAVCLAVVLIAIDLYVDLRHLRPLKRQAAVVRAAEHGVAYAEQLARGRALKGPEKFTHALACARDELKSSGVKFTDAEIGRAIEIALSGAAK